MSMIRKILIANRGEIACRIMRTCREMGIATVAVYSDADARALHVDMADEAVHLGASAAEYSYMNIEKLVRAARRTGADAVHPGYGFLAENAGFARVCEQAGLNFIGPSAQAIEAMGSKRGAKRLVRGVPTIPGYSGEDQTDARLLQEAEAIGYPIMVKASAGGGGRAMRQVNTAEALPAALETTRQEARQLFGDDTLILEQVIPNPRHIEVQIFGDKLGNIIALGERECTIQRRYQKIIEETPSMALTPQLRSKLFKVACGIGTQLGYYSAGTVEFLVDEAHQFYFLEMNTRLQVEHPITEETTGFDLVRWQIMVAEGFPLPDMDVYPAGHAIEVRICADDPARAFSPSGGKILKWKAPDHVRIESGVRMGDEVTIHYEPVLAKVIAYGEHREGAIRRLDHALGQLQLLGLQHNTAFLRRILTHPDHVAGRISTLFIETHPELFTVDATAVPAALIAAAIRQMRTRREAATSAPMDVSDGLTAPARVTFRHGNRLHELMMHVSTDETRVELAGQDFRVRVLSESEHEMAVEIDGHRQVVGLATGADGTWWTHVNGEHAMLEQIVPAPATRDSSDSVQ